MVREIAAGALLCEKFRFGNSGIECKRARYKSTSTDRHYHDDTNVVLSLSGSLTQAMCSRSTVLPPGSLMYVPAGEVHATDFGPRGALCFFVSIENGWLDQRLESPVAASPKIITRGFLPAFAHKIYEEFKAPDSLSDLIVEGALLELLGRWHREDNRPCRDAPGWLRTVRTLLDDSFREPISLRELSHAVGVHSSHISRQFHRVYGMTAGEYIRKRRVEFVMDSLRRAESKDLSLTDLALEAGFSSHAHMSATFKRVTGMAPSQYNKTHAPHQFCDSLSIS
jgi:AraC family transcriptional regulator